MPDQPDQKQPGTSLTFYQALTQAIELWNKTPVAVLDEQLAQTHALILAMGKYITDRKEKGQLDTCDDASDFLVRLTKRSLNEESSSGGSLGKFRVSLLGVFSAERWPVATLFEY
jgi:hypothetical protein